MRYYFIQNAKIIPKKFGGYSQIAYLCTVFKINTAPKILKKRELGKFINLKSHNDGKCEKAFNGLGRTKKVEFISKNIELASSSAVADYVKGYLFDVLKDVGDDEYVATYLRGKGYKVEKK